MVLCAITPDHSKASVLSLLDVPETFLGVYFCLEATSSDVQEILLPLHSAVTAGRFTCQKLKLCRLGARQVPSKLYYLSGHPWDFLIQFLQKCDNLN